MSSNRGGSTGGRGGRGGSRVFLAAVAAVEGGRGGGSSGQAAPLRGHGSRGGFGNTKDYHNRRGGSFTSGGGSGGGHSSMGNSSFRSGRGPTHSSGRGGRHDGGGGSVFGTRDGPMASSFSSGGKKDENRRTLTDFKIIGLEMRELGWTWGILPSPSPVKTEVKDEASEDPDTSQVSVKQEATETGVLSISEKVDDVVRHDHVAVGNTEAATAPAELKPAATASTDTFASQSKDVSTASLIPPPPSRIRIYFHTPVSADDSHPMSLNNSSSLFSLGPPPSDSRKGKRKKLEDDDGDLEQGRGKRPPPQMGGSQISDTASVDMDMIGRGSVAPSVAETNSEVDWLMAAVVQDEADGDQNEDADGDEDQLNVSQIEDTNDTEVGDDYNDGKFLFSFETWRTFRVDDASSREK